MSFLEYRLAGWLEESGWRRTALCTIRHGGWIGTSMRDRAMSSIMYESSRGVVLLVSLILFRKRFRFVRKVRALDAIQVTIFFSVRLS